MREHVENNTNSDANLALAIGACAKNDVYVEAEPDSFLGMPEFISLGWEGNPPDKAEVSICSGV